MSSSPVESENETGRRAYGERAWSDAYEALSRASAHGPLDAADLERLAFAAGLSGQENVEVLERLHQLRLDSGDPLGAARAAFWAAMRCFWRGETARGSGWVARAQRLVEAEGRDCVECGYVRLPQVSRLIASGEYAEAPSVAREIVHDWRSSHRVHRAYVLGCLALLISGPVRFAVGHGAAWHSFARLLVD